MNTLDSEYAKMIVNVKLLIADQKFVCTTADVWSSRATSFFGMTLHYIDSKYERKSILLAFQQMKGKQTYIEITQTIRNIFAKFNIPSEIVTHIVTDGGSAFGKAFKKYGCGADPLVEFGIEENTNENEQHSGTGIPFIQYDDGEQFYSNIMNLEDDFDDSEIDENENEESDGNTFESRDDEFFHFDDDIERCDEPVEIPNPNDEQLPKQRRCLSHQLNLIGTDFEKDISGKAKGCFMSTMNKLQAIWVFPRKSCRTKTFCKEILLCLLLIPCLTRWNSKFDAVERVLTVGAIKMEKYINALKQNMKSAAHLMQLEREDWLVINVYVKVLKPIALALDRLQGEKICSQGYILPTLFAMKHHLQNMDVSNFLKSCRDSMLNVVNKRFHLYFGISDSNKELLLASVSLPRFKTNFIEDNSDCLFVKSLLISAFSETENSNSMDLREDKSTENATDSFFISYAVARSSRRGSFEQSIEIEVSNYLMDARENFEMLKDYPNVKNVFFKYNTTLASSAPIERVFSQSNIIFAPRRNRILPINFEKLLFVKHNKKLLNI